MSTTPKPSKTTRRRKVNVEVKMESDIAAEAPTPGECATEQTVRDNSEPEMESVPGLDAVDELEDDNDDDDDDDDDEEGYEYNPNLADIRLDPKDLERLAQFPIYKGCSNEDITMEIAALMNNLHDTYHGSASDRKYFWTQLYQFSLTQLIQNDKLTKSQADRALLDLKRFCDIVTVPEKRAILFNLYDNMMVLLTTNKQHKSAFETAVKSLTGSTEDEKDEFIVAFSIILAYIEEREVPEDLSDYHTAFVEIYLNAVSKVDPESEKFVSRRIQYVLDKLSA